MDTDLEIRNDIYPEADPKYRLPIINRWVDYVSSVYPDSFPSRDILIKYLNEMTDPKNAELFLEISRFYGSAKFFVCQRCGNHIEKCPQCNRDLVMPPYAVLVIIIGIMEKLSRGRTEYISFKDWISSRENKRRYQERLRTDVSIELKELIEIMKEDYHEIFGSISSVTNFANNYLTREEKMGFIKSIRYAKDAPDLPPHFDYPDDVTEVDIEKYFKEKTDEINKIGKIDDIRKYVKDNIIEVRKIAAPICFDSDKYWECYCTSFFRGGGIGYCHFNFVDCKLLKDDNLLYNCFNEIIKTVYEWRSKVVHGDRLPPLSENAMLGDIYEGESIAVELTSERLRKFMDLMIMRYFEKLK